MIAPTHPEQALARAIDGTLSDTEREPLERHLAECIACRAHLALASAARESLQPRPGDDDADRLNIERALASVAAISSTGAQSNPVARRARYEARAPRRAVPWRIGLIAAALLIFGGAAAAAWLERAPALPPQGPAAIVTPQGSHPKATRRPPTVAEHQTPAEPELEPTPLPLPLTSAPESSPPSAPESASSLFRKASALRADGEADAAIAAFLKLQKQFPQSRESSLSLLVAGRLLLERGRPAQALGEFDRYLKESGDASEHALAGRAAALQALGRTDAEASTWQRLLSAFPRSVYGKRAKARLAELRPGQAGPTGSTRLE